MNKVQKGILESQAREMLIAGESFDSIISLTGLRLKDVKKVQHAEIRSRF